MLHLVKNAFAGCNAEVQMNGLVIEGTLFNLV